MKTVKRFFLILLFICLLLQLKAVQNSRLSTYTPTFEKTIVFASENEWAQIISENTPFFADRSLLIVKFYLPKTYFVKVINAEDDATRVKYFDGQKGAPFKEGYVRTCDLFLFDGTPTNPYPQITLTVAVDEVLFADSNKEHPKTVVTKGNEATFYGELKTGEEIFCYVYYNGYVGYVRKSAFEPFEIAQNPLLNQIEEENSALESEQIKQEENSLTSANLGLDSTMKIVVIISIALVCVSVIYLIFKPKQTLENKIALWRDEDDY